jgi:Glycogen recognition site of AMP-activated protein kinase
MRVFSSSKDREYFTDYSCNMTDKFIKIFLTAASLMFIIIIPCFSNSGQSLSIHIEVSELKEAKNPMFIDNKILFTYFNGKNYTRRVAIAFDIDGYKNVYSLQKNEYNVFFLARNIPEKMAYLNYRLIVDGVWTDDPHNENNFLSPENIKVSRVNIPDIFREQVTYPIIETNRNVKFIYKDDSNKNVYLSGNFNNWDPFMLKMYEEKENPGTYSISLRMSAGQHFYKFITDGLSVQDPNNPGRAYDLRGNAVSIIRVQ